jgi:hypothetical protein
MNAISLLQAHITGGSKPVLGDFLVIAGTIFFALSNVGEVSKSCLHANNMNFNSSTKS